MTVLMVPMTLEVLLPCYFGSELSSASSKLSSSLFHTGWISKSKDLKKIALIFMEYTKKNTQFRLSELFQLNLETFTAIANTSYSLYSILKKMH